MKIYSNVPGHKGLCKSTWINNNSVDRRLDRKVTGFFVNVRKHWLLGFVRTGAEFYGQVKNGEVWPV